MVGVWVAAGAAILGLVGVIINVVCTVKGGRKTAREIAELQSNNAKFLEQSRQKHQLSLAAIDRVLARFACKCTLIWIDLVNRRS